MTLARDEELARIEEAILAENLPPVPGVLTGYILLTEWVAMDGEVYLVESRPEGQAYWRSLGMLEAHRMSINQTVSNYSVEDEEEDGE